MKKVIDNTNLGYLISKEKAAFWQKTESLNVVLDDVPTENSNNLVKSGGVYDAIEDVLDAIDGTNVETVTVLPTASASTVGKIYYVGPDSNGDYARYRGIESGGSYSFLSLGSTEINLTNYATKDEVDQLEAKVTDLQDGETVLQQQIDAIQPVVIEGNVTNAPDNEDITATPDNRLKFKDRPATLTNKGYKILRSDKTFAEQVTDINTTYEVRYAFDLGGEEITVPSGCSLNFVGGVLKNGTLVGDETALLGKPDFRNVFLSGKYENPDIFDSWFSPNEYGNSWVFLNMFFNIANLNKDTVLHLSRNYDVDIQDYEGAGYWAQYFSQGNTYLFEITGSLRLVGNNSTLTILNNGGRLSLDAPDTRMGFFFVALTTAESKESVLEVKGVNFDMGFDTTEETYVHDFRVGNCAFCIRQNTGYFRTIRFEDCDFSNSESESIQSADTINKDHPGTMVVKNCRFTNLLGAGVNLNTYKGDVVGCIFTNTKESVEWAAKYGSSLVVNGCKFINSRLPLIANLNIASSGVYNTSWPDASAAIVSIVNCYIENSDEWNAHIKAIAGANTAALSSMTAVATPFFSNCTFRNFHQLPDTFRNCSAGLYLNCFFEKCLLAGTGDNTKYIGCIFDFTVEGGFQNVQSNQFFENCRFFFDMERSTSFNLPCPSIGTMQVIGTTEDATINSKVQLNVSDNSIPMYNKSYTSTPVKSEEPIAIHRKNFQVGILGVKATITNTTGTVKYKLNFRLSSAMRQMQGYHIPRTATDMTGASLYCVRGYNIYDVNLYRPLWYNDNVSKWQEYDGASVNVNRSGTFASKPASADIFVGFRYFCTDRQTAEGATNGIEIIYKGGGVWVDALGRTVS